MLDVIQELMKSLGIGIDRMLVFFFCSFQTCLITILIDDAYTLTSQELTSR